MKAAAYPLEALLALRGREVDAAEADVARAVGSRESAERALAGVRARLVAHETDCARVRAEEASRLARGEVRGQDLAIAAAWESAARAQAERLAGEVERAEADVTRAHEGEREARRVLAERTAARDVVAKDEARFRAERARARAAAEEEEAADVHGARRSG